MRNTIMQVIRKDAGCPFSGAGRGAAFCFLILWLIVEPIAKLEKFLQRKKEGLRQRLKDFLSSIKN
jgi:hypothetical protein